MNHAHFMQHAIALAKRGQNTTTPNPNVGCVLVKNGQIIGEGFHQQAGQPHAEVNALKNAKDNGFSPRDAVAYVTLEPCSHYGLTPPCADALIQSGVAEVIIGSADPNPKVSGRGVAKLRQAGIAVTENILREQCDELNCGFFKRMTTGMPWVTVKLGMTLDAKIATKMGESQWITNQAARADVQQLRAKSCAIMTSSATVIADNPSLNVRLDNAIRQPKRVIVDSHLSVSPQAKIFQLAGEVLLYHSSQATKIYLENTHRENTQLITVPFQENHANLTVILKDLATRQQCNNLLVEAGGRFVGALLAKNLVDELVIYTAPLLFGEGAKPAFNFPSVEKMMEAKRFDIKDCHVIGDNIKTTFRKIK